MLGEPYATLGVKYARLVPNLLYYYCGTKPVLLSNSIHLLLNNWYMLLFWDLEPLFSGIFIDDDIYHQGGSILWYFNLGLVQITWFFFSHYHETEVLEHQETNISSKIRLCFISPENLLSIAHALPMLLIVFCPQVLPSGVCAGRERHRLLLLWLSLCRQSSDLPKFSGNAFPEYLLIKQNEGLISLPYLLANKWTNTTSKKRGLKEVLSSGERPLVSVYLA